MDSTFTFPTNTYKKLTVCTKSAQRYSLNEELCTVLADTPTCLEIDNNNRLRIQTDKSIFIIRFETLNGPIVPIRIKKGPSGFIFCDHDEFFINKKVQLQTMYDYMRMWVGMCKDFDSKPFEMKLID